MKYRVQCFLKKAVFGQHPGDPERCRPWGKNAKTKHEAKDCAATFWAGWSQLATVQSKDRYFIVIYSLDGEKPAEIYSELEPSRLKWKRVLTPKTRRRKTPPGIPEVWT